MTTNDSHAGSTRLFVYVWLWLVLFTLLEVVLAYRQFTLALLIIILMGLSIMKSALIMAYFMHMKFERRSLTLTLIPALVILISLLFISFPDSVRVQSLLPK